MTYETNGNVVRLFHENQVEHIGTEVIELPTEKHEPRGKKRGQKSEVFAYDPTDMAKVIAFFAEKNMWIHYLLFTIQVNSARRVGDLIGYVNKDSCSGRVYAWGTCWRSGKSSLPGAFGSPSRRPASWQVR